MSEADSLAASVDRFGNRVDPSVGYARGQILSCPADEIRRTLHARNLIRQRVALLGEDSIFDLSGLPRSYPLSTEDLVALRSQVNYYARIAGTGESLAVRFMGGDPRVHDALFLNRLSSGLLAVALALVARDDAVVSLVPKGRSHPPVQRSMEVAGARFFDVEGIDAFASVVESQHPRLVVITPVTSAKHHLPVEHLARAAELAHAAGAVVFVDDAHMASRIAFYADPLPFQSGPIDLAIFSTDKHIFGPRAGILVGTRLLVDRVRTAAVQFGLEAQSGHYAAMVRALERHRPQPIQEAGELAGELLRDLERRFGAGSFYAAGPGVAASGEDVLAIGLGLSGKTDPSIVPVEAVSLVCSELLNSHGLLTISSVSMPGSAAALRLMMFPDGVRAGRALILAALESEFAKLGDAVDRPELARAIILGPEG